SQTLAGLASVVASETVEQFVVPANLIPVGCERITPDMLPLIALEPVHIERIVQAVSGGVANVRDIYPLAPLQEGILFHHLMSGQNGDPYIRPMVFSLRSRQRLHELVAALQAVVDRHDMLRTAVLWEDLPSPVQVVYRAAELAVDDLPFDPSRAVSEQVSEW